MLNMLSVAHNYNFYGVVSKTNRTNLPFYCEKARGSTIIPLQDLYFVLYIHIYQNKLLDYLD